MPRLHALANEEGVTLAELMAALAILIVLVAIAVPTFFGATGTAKDTQAQSDLRTALAPLKAVIIEDPTTAAVDAKIKELLPSAIFDVNAVDGIKVERSADGAVCMWRISDSGTVYGVWEPAYSTGETLFVELSALPAACPITADAPGVGFVTGGW